MSLMLIHLIRYAGNLADLRGLSRSSCRADVAKQGNNEDDDSINCFKEGNSTSSLLIQQCGQIPLEKRGCFSWQKLGERDRQFTEQLKKQHACRDNVDRHKREPESSQSGQKTHPTQHTATII
jgi:hypothetical protein